jgi:hypothetical protein
VHVHADYSVSIIIYVAGSGVTGRGRRFISDNLTVGCTLVSFYYYSIAPSVESIIVSSLAPPTIGQQLWSNHSQREAEIEREPY